MMDVPGFVWALCGGMALIVGAGAKAYATIRKAQVEAVNEARRAADTATVAANTAEENKAAVEKVHKIVNSRDTAQRRELKVLNERVVALTDLLAKKERRKPIRKKPPPKRKRKR